MKILLTNDDGIYAKGLYALAKELEKEHEVIIVAPDDQRSACGHSITITRPFIIRKIDLEGLKSKAFSVDGTPADCVRVGMGKIVEGKVDMVVSGINRGSNLGTDVLYSGTVSAAIESAIYKNPAIAISLDSLFDLEENYKIAAKYGMEILEKAREMKLKNDMVLNVNVPCLPENEIKGIKVCGLGNRNYSYNFIESINENKETCYELRGRLLKQSNVETDVDYVKQGYVTLTPLHYDLTNYKTLKDVGQWFG